MANDGIVAIELICCSVEINKRPNNLDEGGLMAEELKAGCARPTGGPVGETAPEKTPEIHNEKTEIFLL
jgi:hypothetical protein